MCNEHSSFVTNIFEVVRCVSSYMVSYTAHRRSIIFGIDVTTQTARFKQVRAKNFPGGVDLVTANLCTFVDTYRAREALQFGEDMS